MAFVLLRSVKNEQIARGLRGCMQVIHFPKIET